MSKLLFTLMFMISIRGYACDRLAKAEEAMNQIAKEYGATSYLSSNGGTGIGKSWIYPFSFTAKGGDQFMSFAYVNSETCETTVPGTIWATEKQVQ